MTGAELYARFEDATDAQYTQYLDDTRASRLMSLAYRNLCKKLLDDAGDGAEVLRELVHMYVIDDTATPTSNVVSLTTDFVNKVFWIIDLKAKFVKSGKTYYNECNVYYGKKNSQLEKATMRYPKYETSGDNLKVYPTNETCTELTCDYYMEPADIDVADNTTDLGFDIMLADQIVREAVIIAASPNRDTVLFQLGQANVETNKASTN